MTGCVSAILNNMAATVVRGAQVKDGTIQRVDIDTATVGQALIAKAVQGSGIALSSTGADAGTGDVTVGLAATIPVGVVTQIYIGSKARLTALANGLRLEIQDSGNNWIIQNEWTEA
jgi:hypothetical protein